MAFIEWEVPQSNKGGRNRIKDNQISLNYTKGRNYSLTFNQSISKDITEKGLTHLRIGYDDTTGELKLVLNKDKGVKLHPVGKQSKCMSMSCKVWIEMLYKYLGFSQNTTRHLVDISNNLSANDNILTYKIMK